MSAARLNELIAAEAIQKRCDELAEQIDLDYAGLGVVLIGVLKGSYMFLADLSRRLTVPVTVDFVQLSSYGEEKSSSGIVHIRKDHDVSIEGRHVLVVEDIVDTGLTLAHLCELLRTRRPASLKVVSMLSKPAARKHEALVDYLGFEIPNQFVVGYGLDHAESFRNLPFIALLND
jgi:hypoxanthine phosphoribosyltransferase